MQLVCYGGAVAFGLVYALLRRKDQISRKEREMWRKIAKRLEKPWN